MFLRQGVKESRPTGQGWLKIEPESEIKLKTVSAGSCILWALDVNDKLYQIREITSSDRSWYPVPILSSTNDFSRGATVRSISATGKELWGVLDNVTLVFGGISQHDGNRGPTNGVLAKLSGITPVNPFGVGWDIVIGVRLILRL